ncbi:MAG TPA: hypothetical protein VHZ26_03630 [Caulobacteraceae bacterium]|nr:hypothetical protein [Caulobacteraceae bacterium]
MASSPGKADGGFEGIWVRRSRDAIRAVRIGIAAERFFSKRGSSQDDEPEEWLAASLF